METQMNSKSAVDLLRNTIPVPVRDIRTGETTGELLISEETWAAVRVAIAPEPKVWDWIAPPLLDPAKLIPANNPQGRPATRARRRDGQTCVLMQVEAGKYFLWRDETGDMQWTFSNGRRHSYDEKPHDIVSLLPEAPDDVREAAHPFRVGDMVRWADGGNMVAMKVKAIRTERSIYGDTYTRFEVAVAEPFTWWPANQFVHDLEAALAEGGSDAN